ncbi:hypothetical protein PsorP6_001136 [Peronosclerospora sorghi]|uniref:Uncharacterized protein n=1 Tax=Peronosclerospora sorghi TaxID=230839 RepID=A0ACC0WW73_9STRA|nr:hypothetical protein PsorP6_001136 [Peronosclerospora sorghi]
MHITDYTGNILFHLKACNKSELKIAHFHRVKTIRLFTTKTGNGDTGISCTGTSLQGSHMQDIALQLLACQLRFHHCRVLDSKPVGWVRKVDNRISCTDNHRQGIHILHIFQLQLVEQPQYIHHTRRFFLYCTRLTDVLSTLIFHLLGLQIVLHTRRCPNHHRLKNYVLFLASCHPVARVTPICDLPLTVWLPHSSGADFVNASFNEYPINKIILSGKLGSNYPDVMDIYHHSGYYVADNQSAIYASYLRSYRTAIRTTLIFQYVIANLFEIPSTGRS